MKLFLFTLLFFSSPVLAQQYNYDNQNQMQENEQQCSATSTILGALIGGGVAASISKPDAYKWSVPLGAVGGGLLMGCDN